MQLTFSDLKKKEVVSTEDGRKLGRVCDVVLCYPDYRWVGIIVPNGHWFMGKKRGLVIDLKKIVKIGEDVILVRLPLSQKSPNFGGVDGERDCGYPLGRNFEEME